MLEHQKQYVAEEASVGKQSDTVRCKLKVVVFTRVAEFSQSDDVRSSCDQSGILW